MLDGVVIDDSRLFNDKLQEWEDFYNFQRGCRQPRWTDDPHERLRQKATTPATYTPTVSRTASSPECHDGGLLLATRGVLGGRAGFTWRCSCDEAMRERP